MNTVGPHQLYYLTVATKPHPGLDMLQQTCKQQQIALDVKGMDDKRLQEWGTSLWVKLDYLKQVLDNMDPKTILLFTDAYDVLCLQPAHWIVNQFLKQNKPILFSAEKACAPDPNLAPQYRIRNQKDYAFPYLNSGTFIGYAGALQEVFKRKPDYKSTGNDQRYWTHSYLEFPDMIFLDHSQELFLCMHQVDLKEVDFSSLPVWFQQKAVGFLHFNGGKEQLKPAFEKWRTLYGLGHPKWQKTVGCNCSGWWWWLGGLLVVLSIIWMVWGASKKSALPKQRMDI